jgi:hypothetical protein
VVCEEHPAAWRMMKATFAPSPASLECPELRRPLIPHFACPRAEAGLDDDVSILAFTAQGIENLRELLADLDPK